MELQNIFLLLLTLKCTTTLARRQENLPASTTCLGNDVFYNNTCMPLLFKGSCGGPRDWLIRDDDGTLQCEPMPCFNLQHHRVLVNGRCTRLGSVEHCPERMIVEALENGHGECDCIESFFFWRNSSHTTSHEGGCYIAFERGPCSEHQVLYVPPVEQGGIPVCRDNPCNETQIPIKKLPNGEVIYSETGKCDTLDSPCGPEKNSGKYLFLDYQSLTLKCDRRQISAVKRVGPFSGLIPFSRHQCRYGSKRQSAGQCQPVLAKIFAG